MKRRRGDMSLFEILREPEDAARERSEDQGTDSQGRGTNRITTPSGAGKSKSGKGTGGKLADLGLESGGPHASPLGSSTPPEPAPEPRPRLDVTPPSRSSLRRGASALPELAPELTSTSLGLDDGDDDEPHATGSPASHAQPWWTRPVLVSPTVLLIALVGVILVGFISYQAGVSTTNETEARRDAYTGGDAPAWSIDDQPVLHSNTTPGNRPEVRFVTNERGEQLGGAAAEAGEYREYPVIVIASGLGRQNDDRAWARVTKLKDYVQTYTEPGSAQITILNNQLAVYVGAFANNAALRSYQKSTISKIKKFGTTRFTETMPMNLEFSAEDLERIPLIGS